MQHPFLIDAVTKLLKQGVSSSLRSFVNSTPLSETSTHPHSIPIGEVVKSNSEQNRGTVVHVKRDGDLVGVCSTVETLHISNNTCNSCELDDWEFCDLSQLRELIIGNECFQYVKSLQFVGFSQLKSVDIGKECFIKVKGGTFEARDCTCLKSVKIGDGSLVAVDRVRLESRGLLEQ